MILVQAVLLLFWTGSALRAGGMRGGGGSEIGVRFGESVYFMAEAPRGRAESALMLVYWTYPLWFGIGAYGAWRCLRKGNSLLATAVPLHAFLPLAAGMFSVAMYAMEVRKGGEKFFAECQSRHPGVEGQIVIREADGKVTDGPRMGSR